MDLLSEASNASSSAQGKKNQCVRSFIDGLFAFFFSAQRAAINTEDACWFLEIANRHAQTDFSQAVEASDDASPFCHCISLNVFKLYLSRILGSVDVSKDQTIYPKVNLMSRSNSSIQFTLLIVHLQTKEMIVQVLMSQGVSGSPGPYIPPFYQLEGSLHIYSIEASKVKEHGNIILLIVQFTNHYHYPTFQNALMQQPLAHLYFLMVLEQLQTKAHSANFLIRCASRLDEVRTSTLCKSL